MVAFVHFLKLAARALMFCFCYCVSLATAVGVLLLISLDLAGLRSMLLLASQVWASDGWGVIVGSLKGPSGLRQIRGDPATTRHPTVPTNSLMICFDCDSGRAILIFGRPSRALYTVLYIQYCKTIILLM